MAVVEENENENEDLGTVVARRTKLRCQHISGCPPPRNPFDPEKERIHSGEFHSLSLVSSFLLKTSL
jgi:hypothetical protein